LSLSALSWIYISEITAGNVVPPLFYAWICPLLLLFSSASVMAAISSGSINYEFVAGLIKSCPTQQINHQSHSLSPSAFYQWIGCANITLPFLAKQTGQSHASSSACICNSPNFL
jgi:hypothetical protein